MTILRLGIFIVFAATLIILLFFIRRKNLCKLNHFLKGLTSGIFLQAIIVCISQVGINYNVYTYGAMFLGMGICVLLEMYGQEKFYWIFPGILAGAVLMEGSLISIIITVFAVIILVFDVLDKCENRKSLNLIFTSALLFFSGEVFGYGLKYYFPILMPVFFSFGSGASIYICSEHILPEGEQRSISFTGGIVGFILGMALYIL